MMDANLEQIVFGNRLLDYLIALLTLVLSLLFVKVVIRSLIRHLKSLAKKTVTTFDDLLVRLIQKVILPALYLSCFYFSLKTLKMPESVQGVFNAVELAVLTFFAVRTLLMFIGYGFSRSVSRKQADAIQANSLQGMLRFVQYFVWVLAAIVFLDNIGFKVSTILAGLGIGGIAVAIAAQTLLKDFFSYFSILFDRPFQLGDFIVIGDLMGTVEHIGIKTTRLRSLGGEQLIFSNSDLTDSRLRNFKVMERRRVAFGLNVTYETPLAKLREIPAIVENVIRKTSDVSFDRAHFSKYGDFSLIFEIVYFVLTPDYNRYMDIQQGINFSIKEEFEKRDIQFAYPTQKLYVST